jgi:hypothetical protein
VIATLCSLLSPSSDLLQGVLESKAASCSEYSSFLTVRRPHERYIMLR